MAAPSDGGAQPPSLKHGVRVVADPRFTVEQVLLGVGEKVGHANITYGSRMNKAVVVFLSEVHLVHDLVESGLVLDNEFVAVSPLFVPSVRVTVSGVPPFISNECVEKELVRFGKLASGLRAVRLGCKDARLQHVQSLRRQCFMFLNDPSGVIELSFAVRHENRPYTLYVSSGSMKCFECGDVGHKRASCPHRARDERGEKAPSAGSETPAASEQPPGLSGTEVAQAEAEMSSESQENNDGNNAEVESEQQQPEQSQEENVNNAPPTAQCAERAAEAEEGSMQSGNEDEDTDDTLSQLSDFSQDMGLEEPANSYSISEINQFLDVTYGKVNVNIQDFFPDVEKFIHSVKRIKKQVGLEQLSQKKRYRLNKLVGRIRKDRKSGGISKVK